MTATGWIGEEPEAAAPAMPLTEMLLARKERRAGPLETALARARSADILEAREAAATAPDADERASGLVARGYLPGQISQLSMRLADTEAELATEEDKIERAARRAERMHREHEAGRIGAFDIMRALGDSDEGDQATVDRLRRRADSLRRQIAEASEIMVPPEARAQNAVEEAASRAQRILADVASQRRADDEAEDRGRAQLRAERAAFRRGERRPFGAGDGTEHTGPDCQVCAEGRRMEAARDTGDDNSSREITRAVGYNDDGEYGNHPVVYR